MPLIILRNESPRRRTSRSARRVRLSRRIRGPVREHLRQLRVLRRQRAFPYPRRVRFHHADDAIHPMRRHARAGAGAARGRV